MPQCMALFDSKISCDNVNHKIVKFHSTWHMNLFGEKGIMSLTSFILAACIAQARRFSSGCGLLDHSSVVAIGLKLTTCEP